jgi:hypothetical protein
VAGEDDFFSCIRRVVLDCFVELRRLQQLRKGDAQGHGTVSGQVGQLRGIGAGIGNDDFSVVLKSTGFEAADAAYSFVAEGAWELYSTGDFGNFIQVIEAGLVCSR